MITTPQQQRPLYDLSRLQRARERVLAVVFWPFTSRLASPIWLALRLYIGWIFFQFSLSKFQAGWVTSDQVAVLFKAIAAGNIPVPLAFYRDIVQMLLDQGMTPLMSQAMPFLELAVALALFSGILVVPAALGGILLVANIILAGIGTPAFDGRVIALLILLILARRVASVIGFERLLWDPRAVCRALHPAPQR